jgi:hypothetical protein
MLLEILILYIPLPRHFIFRKNPNIPFYRTNLSRRTLVPFRKFIQSRIIFEVLIINNRFRIRNTQRRGNIPYLPLHPLLVVHTLRTVSSCKLVDLPYGTFALRSISTISAGSTRSEVTYPVHRKCFCRFIKCHLGF